MLRAVGVSESAVEMTAVRAALLRVSDELGTLVASAANADVAVPGSDWNVSDVTAHLALGTEAYVAICRESPNPSSMSPTSLTAH